MDNSTITVNSDNTSCAGSVRLSSDNFSNCIRFADNRSTSDNTTFVFFPRDNLSDNTTYKIKVTTSVKDEASNSMNLDIMGADFESQVKSLDPEKNYFMYCRSGARSANACMVLKHLGFRNKIVNLEGGILDWTGEVSLD